VLAVVGGGDTAMEESLYLTKFASEVLIIHRRDSFRASKMMASRVLGHPKIRVLWNTRVTDVLGEEEISGLRLEDTVTHAQRDLEVGGPVRRHRPRAEHRLPERAARDDAARLHRHVAGTHRHRRSAASSRPGT
jgi:thioredoxin reductase (NADPH)